QQPCTVGGMSQCVDVTSNPNNCGACNNVCQPVPNAAPVCISSACAFSCNPGFLNCNMAPADGCEPNIQVAPNNCGGCGVHRMPGTPCQNGTCAATPGQLQVSVTSIGFPGVPLGNTFVSPIPVQLTNVGGTPVVIMTVSLGGMNPGDFAFFPPPPPSLPP